MCRTLRPDMSFKCQISVQCQVYRLITPPFINFFISKALLVFIYILKSLEFYL